MRAFVFWCHKVRSSHVTNSESSLDLLNEWAVDVKTNLPGVFTVLVANKVDIDDDDDTKRLR